MFTNSWQDLRLCGSLVSFRNRRTLKSSRKRPGRVRLQSVQKNVLAVYTVDVSQCHVLEYLPNHLCLSPISQLSECTRSSPGCVPYLFVTTPSKAPKHPPPPPRHPQPQKTTETPHKSDKHAEALSSPHPQSSARPLPSHSTDGSMSRVPG